MDVRHGIATLCLYTHGRVLRVLAPAQGPLTRRQVASAPLDPQTASWELPSLGLGSRVRRGVANR